MMNFMVLLSGFRRLSGLGAIAILISASCASGAAYAQQAEPSAEQNSPPAIEEIIVTATRRATTVQDTPINIAAISAAAIEREGLHTLSDATRSVPGINTIDQGPRGGSAIVVRGINAAPLVNNDNSNNGGGTVATYLGEMPVFIELKLNDLERVEVLLGPQGTLYGAGTLGGAIRYIPKRPDFDASSFEIRGDTFRYSEADSQSFGGGATVNVAISESFALRASVDWFEDSGFIDQKYVVREPGVSLPNDFSDPLSDNFEIRKDTNDEETLSGRVAARYAPSDAIDINLTYYFQFQEIGGRQSSSSRVDSMPVSFGKYESAMRVFEPADRDNQLIALEATFDLGFAELTSATGYSNYDLRSQRDQTDLGIELGYGYELFPALVVFTDEQLEEDRFNQEFRLVSKGDGQFSWTAGAFYNHFERQIDYTEFTPGLHDFWGFDTGDDDRDWISVDRNERTEYAAYAELSYEWNDAWMVTFGGRYYDYDVEIASAFAFPPYPAEGPDFTFSPDGRKDDGMLGKFNISYRVSPEVLAFGTISQGYRAGNSNALPPCPVPLTPTTFFCAQPNELFYKPDTTTNYEVGIKSQWMDRRVTFNGSVFYIDWKDVQLASSTEVGALGITVNGNGATSKGVEFSFDAQVTDKLRLQGSYAYTDAELDELSPDLIRTIVPPGFANRVYVDGEAGDRLPGSAKNRGSISLFFAEPISDRFDLDVMWSSVFSGDVLSTPGARGDSLTLPSYSVSFARIALTDTRNDWSLALYADNVFDEFVEVSTRGTSLYNQSLPDVNGDPVYNRRFSTGISAPRRVGLRLTKAF